MPDLQRTGALVTEHPPLGEKVAVFVASLPEQARDARIADLAYRTRERIRGGAQDYTLAGGTERHEFATPTEEAANFREEIEDALAYAANSWWTSHDPRWLALAPILAEVWAIARRIEKPEQYGYPLPGNVRFITCRVDETNGGDAA
jgi:hypothetical protein